MTFSQKIQAACRAKEELIDQHMVRYAVKSIFAGAFLTLSTGVGGIAADVINQIHPSLGRFVFPFIFSFGLVYILFLNSELVTSNMMYLTAGAYYRYISVKKVLKILVVCTLFNLVGAALIAALFNQSFAYTLVTPKSFLVGVVQTKLAKTSSQIFFDAIIANIFVNIAILSYLLVKDQTAKTILVISAIFMFVFMNAEHLVANFSSFLLMGFNSVHLDGYNLANILRHWGISFIGNWIGGGLLIGAAYAFLNKKENQ
ncbi:formate/nitrite transporter family protein [Streptococcus downei]|uniref:Formate-nitrate transporter n=1 Tax=Streptococcus downei MFe28 TaxID=764290 RepID=A0A380JGP9_STRDO|nr:formate/nitrite transporter family protein [Streptococcus downei]EFQ58035.1 formate/nitrite transporter [Streptococcus downei F0415]SUN37374.1 formate-nitrate transporter [Streptococcus downei MFe28]